MKRIEIANLLLLAALFSVTGWYLWDTWRASGDILNLIFVLPLTLVILVLCAVAFFRDWLLSLPVPEEESDSDPSDTLVAILLFVGYVLTLPWLGFDVGTFVFLALFLWRAGERSWLWAVGYAAVFAVATALFFSYMLPYPMPLLLLPGGN